MSNYKIVFKQKVEEGSNRNWEAGCPLTVAAVQISRDVQSGQAFLQAQVQNISDSTVDSYSLSIKVQYSDGTEETQEQTNLDADISAGSIENIKPLKLEKGDVENAEMLITKVVQDGNVWTPSGSPTPLPHQNVLKLSENAQNERKKQLMESHVRVSSPERSVVDEGSYWICTCGQLNGNRDTCVACRFNREDAQRLENEALLEEAHDKRLKEERQRSEAEAEKKRALQARVKKGCIAAAIIIVIAVVAFFAYRLISDAMESAAQEASNQVAFTEAVSAMDAGEYEDAFSLFLDLGDYQDSQEKASEAAQRVAEAAQANGENAKAYIWFMIADDPSSASGDVETLLESDASLKFNARYAAKGMRSCKLYINNDDTCILSIPAWGEALADFEGDWYGTVANGLILFNGFPGGDVWKMVEADGEMRLQSLDDDKNYFRLYAA